MARRPILAACRLAAILVAASAVASFAARADGFLSVIEDVPLMDGFTELTGESVSFETADGRIAEAQATAAPSARLTARAARDFYAAALPALGWSAIAPGRYVREGELLTVTVSGAAAGMVLRFALAPWDGGPAGPGRYGP